MLRSTPNQAQKCWSEDMFREMEVCIIFTGKAQSWIREPTANSRVRAEGLATALAITRMSVIAEECNRRRKSRQRIVLARAATANHHEYWEQEDACSVTVRLATTEYITRHILLTDAYTVQQYYEDEDSPTGQLRPFA